MEFLVVCPKLLSISSLFIKELGFFQILPSWLENWCYIYWNSKRNRHSQSLFATWLVSDTSSSSSHPLYSTVYSQDADAFLAMPFLCCNYRNRKCFALSFSDVSLKHTLKSISKGQNMQCPFGTNKVKNNLKFSWPQKRGSIYPAKYAWDSQSSLKISTYPTNGQRPRTAFTARGRSTQKCKKKKKKFKLNSLLVKGMQIK